MALEKLAKIKVKGSLNVKPLEPEKVEVIKVKP